MEQGMAECLEPSQGPLWLFTHTHTDSGLMHCGGHKLTSSLQVRRPAPQILPSPQWQSRTPRQCSSSSARLPLGRKGQSSAEDLFLLVDPRLWSRHQPN